MRLISILFAFAGMAACDFHGEVDPDIECSSSCEDDQSNCHDQCEQTCIEDDDGTALRQRLRHRVRQHLRTTALRSLARTTGGAPA